MLALGIRYLNGFVAASMPDDWSRVEWPPHPGRVFMALAAAHFQTGGDPDERRALRWLESQEEDGEPAAPIVVAAASMQRAIVTQFVPVNPQLADERKARTNERKKGKKPPPILQTAPGIIRTRRPRTFTRAWLDEDTVYLVWRRVEPDETVREALKGLCAKVTRIGHSTSMVQMWLAAADEPGEPTWIPDEDRAVIYLRLVPCGTLEYLEHRFNGDAVKEFGELKAAAADVTNLRDQRTARKILREKYNNEPPPQLRPNLSVFQGYARPNAAESESGVAGTVLAPHFIVLRLQPEQGSYRQLDLACALTIVSRWRDALLSRSNDLPPCVRRILSGHDTAGLPLKEPHLALLPLPFVGHEHADGHLLGMAAALPRTLSAEERRGVLRDLGRVRRLELGRLGVWRLEPVTEARPPWNLQSAAWTAHPRGATQWSTVTPIVFDRHPKAKDKAAYREELAAMVGCACTRVGLIEPREVVVTPASAHLGAPPAYAFPSLHRKDGSRRGHTHAILVFDVPVCGPIVLGAGRYRGYGLCRPLDGKRAEETTS